MIHTTKKVSLLLGFVLMVFAIQAQPGQGRQGGRNIDPTEMATLQTDNMVEHLELTDEQREEVYAINLKYAEKMKSMRDEMRSGGDNVDRREIMGQMTDMRAQRGKELKGVLTKPQYKIWKKEAIKRDEKWENRQGQGRPGGPPPGPGRDE